MRRPWALPFSTRQINDDDPGHQGPSCRLCAGYQGEQLASAAASPMLHGSRGQLYQSPHAATYLFHARYSRWACTQGVHGALVEGVGGTVATAPPVRRLLDLSTAHLPQHLGSDGLSAADGVTAYQLAYGWLMWVPEDPDRHAADYPELPPEVLTVQRYARRHGCDYVLFDRDADTVADLPTFTW